MKHFKHENILCLRDVMLPGEGPWDDLYLVTDRMDADLQYIIHSGQTLNDGHIQFFLYQIFRGLKAMHSASVIHRDLKPSNILVNANCDLRIADFGLARAVEDSAQAHMTEYVVTRWYRAPELCVQNSQYNQAVDIWSVGCIFAECLGRRVLLKGKDYLHQIRLILDLIGTPSEAELESTVQNPLARDYILARPRCPGMTVASLYPQASPVACDLLARLLMFDPRRRPTAADGLNHPYLQDLQDLNDAPDAPSWTAGYDHEGIDESDLRALVWEEMKSFHPGVGPVPPSFSNSPARVMDL